MDEKKKVPGWVGSCLGFAMTFMFLGMGLFAILISLNIIQSPEENFKSPHAVVGAAGLIFFLAGLVMLMGLIFSAEELRLPILLWIQFLLVLGALAAFSGVFLWTGFGSGERQFSTSTSIGPVATSSSGNETVGRLLFGGFGLLGGLLTVSYAVNGTRSLINGEFKSVFDQNNREAS
jgi:hypothetical protein